MNNNELIAIMAANLKKRDSRRGEEEVVESLGGSSGELSYNRSSSFKKKAPPGAQAIGMHAMLLHEATRGGGAKLRLKKVPKKHYGVKLKSVSKDHLI